MRLYLKIGLFALAVCVNAFAAAPTTRNGPGQCYALLISGNPGSPLYARRSADWLLRFHAYATAPGRMPGRNVVVLCGDKELKSPIVSGPATADAVREALAELSKKTTPADQLVVFIVGHGAVTELWPTLLLPGPDLRCRDLAEALDAVPAGNQVILNFAGASGDFVKPLAKRGRVNLAATSAGEEAEPVFCEFFLRALESGQADGQAPLPLSSEQAATRPAPDPAALLWRTGAKDGQVSVLEAYNWATHETAMWIMRQKMDGDAWVVEGEESVRIFKKLCTGDDKDPAARKLSAASDATRPDAAVPLKMKQGATPDQWWIGRRALSEHAVLEDCGAEAAISALRGAGYEPLDGLKDGQPGHLARRVVIGKAGLLDVEVGK